MFTNWCTEHGYDQVSVSVVEVLSFLQLKSLSVAYNTILSYVTAISERHAKLRVGRNAVPLAKIIWKMMISIRNILPVRDIMPVLNSTGQAAHCCFSAKTTYTPVIQHVIPHYRGLRGVGGLCTLLYCSGVLVGASNTI